MAGISKAERERRAAEEAAAAASTTQGGTGTGTNMAPAADGAAITGDGSGDQLPPGDGDGDDLVDQLQDAGPTLVHMTRDASAYPAPHNAEVHPAEVDNYAAGGWQVAAD